MRSENPFETQAKLLGIHPSTLALSIDGCAAGYLLHSEKPTSHELCMVHEWLASGLQWTVQRPRQALLCLKGYDQSQYTASRDADLLAMADDIEQQTDVNPL